MNILIVDDEAAIRFSLVELLEADDHTVRAVEHAPAALAALETEPADLVLSDLRMPAIDGLALLDEIRSRHSSPPAFVLMTAHGDERTAVAALKAGAYDYLPKPWDNDEVRSLVARVHEMLALRAENERLRAELADRHGPLVGGSPAMRTIYQLIERVGPTDAAVLITGESGTGKELVARALHEAGSRHANSPRSGQAGRHQTGGRLTGNFIALNCSALAPELIESELFGHAKGSFTGANSDREGLFEAANGGTLFLDEIADLSAGAQAKLLRALEDRTIRRVGESRARPVDVRIIAATNRPLERMVGDGTFRDDLLYRLRVIQIDIPPLRERREDIIPIAIHMIHELATRHQRHVNALADDARRALLAHDWPGNVRELRNAIERAIILADGPALTAADLPASVTRGDTPLRPTDAAFAGLLYNDALARARRDFDRAFLVAALERHGGNITRTAEALGLHRQSLQKLLRKAGL